MSKTHGVKKHYQVLLDEHRATLVDEVAKERGLRATAWIRELVYAELQKLYSASTYGVAEAKDQAARREAISRQVSGRCEAAKGKQGA